MQKLDQSIKIRRHLPTSLHIELAKILKQYKDIFVWSSSDLGIIPHSIAEHKLGIPEGTKLAFQKKMAFAKARQDVIKKELKDLLEARIIKPINFPECLSNQVVVAKPKGAWRVCINFTNLNKAIPKKFYPFL